jgi:ParB family chromosome partitioning protein
MSTLMLKIEQIDPNDYNPNHMTPEQFDACVAEIRNNGDVLKPLIVRLIDDRYQIIDGEHSWRAARTAGLQEITCQVVDVDDFEAMRQTLVRNDHGTHNAVREALVYERMKADRKLSNRGLAAQLNTSEATIRNRLKYLEVYERYEAVDGEDPIEKIGSFTQAQIDLYHQLPLELGKTWLTAGADMRIKDWVRLKGAQPLTNRLGEIVDAGLASLISPDWFEFRDTVAQALALADWAKQHLGVFSAEGYLRPVMQLQLPVQVLDSLPRQITDGQLAVLLPPDSWAAVMTECASRASDGSEAVALASILVRAALRTAGIDPLSIASTKELAKHDFVLAGPELIRSADFLTLDEQSLLAMFAHTNPGDTAQDAIRLTVEHFRNRRTGAPSQDGSAEPPAQLQDVLQHHVDQLLKAQRQASTEFLPAEDLVAHITSILLQDDDRHLVDEPVSLLLQERLTMIQPPELALLADLLDDHGDSYEKAIDRWRAAAELLASDRR